MGSIQNNNNNNDDEELILITGATGHLGFKTLLDALHAGYRVRAAVRSEAKANTIISNEDFKALGLPSGQLEFIVVPDLATPGAYDMAVKDVKAIIHIASPITTGGKLTADQYDEYFIKPAISGTLGMLKSAAGSPTVERIVITSSVVAIIDFMAFTSGSEKLVTAEDRIPFPSAPYHNEFHAYAASKTLSLNEAEAWMTEAKPHFDVVFIHPSFIEGRGALVKTPEEAMVGTNGAILRVVLGVNAPFAYPGNTVHNDDVARLHVEALNKVRIPAGSYIASSNTPHGSLDGTRWETINEIVAKNFPAEVSNGVLKNTGLQPSVKNPFSVSKTEKTFGWHFQEFDAQVKSVVQMYLDVLPDV
jgi:nucleoside-diphosphate-sugar epimerase